MPEGSFRFPSAAGEPPPRNPFEETTRRLSKTVIHAAQRGRESLFFKLTAASAERIATLSKETPIFVENDPSAPSVVLLSEGIKAVLPKEFFDGPSAWIEEQSNVSRPEVTGDQLTATTIEELWQKKYDISRVKEFELQTKDGPVKIISKRLSKPGVGTAEAAIHQRAYEAGVPTVRMFGEVFDRGNVYLWLEKWPGINLTALGPWIAERRQETDELSARMVEENRNDRSAGLERLGFSAQQAEELRPLLTELDEVDLDREAFSLLTQKNNERIRKELYGDRISDAPVVIDETPAMRSFLQRATGVDRIDTFFSLSKSEIDEGMKQMKRLYVPKLNRIRSEMSSICYRRLFNSEPININEIESKASELRKLCIEKGFPHPDFASQNILIGWNAEKNEPYFDTNGKIELRVIDWEPVKGVNGL